MLDNEISASKQSSLANASVSIVVSLIAVLAIWFLAPLPPTDEAAQRQREKTGLSLGASSTPHETLMSYLRKGKSDARPRE